MTQKPDWSTKVEWMRKVGAAEASWTAKGQLLTIKLGPEPSPEVDLDEIDAKREAREHSDAARRLDQMLAAVPRIRPYSTAKRH